MRCKKVLALDLATNLGWAVGQKGHVEDSGSYKIRGSSLGEKLKDYSDWLADKITDWQPCLIIYENPVIYGGRLPTAQLLVGLSAQTEYVAHIRDVVVDKASPSTIKKSFTNSGKATKDDMVLEAFSRGLIPEIDVKKYADEVDAQALLLMVFGKWDAQ